MLFRTDAEVILHVTEGLDHAGFDTSSGTFTNGMRYSVQRSDDIYLVQITARNGTLLRGQDVYDRYAVVKMLLEASTW